MLLLDLLRRSGRSLLSAKTRTLLTALAIAVGAFALTLTIGASNGANHYADVIVKDNFDPTELIATGDKDLFSSTDSSKPQEYNDNLDSITTVAGSTRQVKSLSDTDIARLQKLPGVESVQPGISPSLQYVTRDGYKKYAATAQAYDSYQKPELLAGSLDGSLKPKTIILPQGFLYALGFSSAHDAVGKVIRISVKQQSESASLLQQLQSGNFSGLQNQQNDHKEEKFTIVAVSKKPSTLIQASTALNLSMNESDLEELNDYVTQGSTSYRRYLSAYVKVTDGTNAKKLDAVEAEVKQAGYGAQSVVDTEKSITQVITVLEGIVTVFGLIAIIASIFGVVNTMYISVLQRTREIGLMKALGMHKKDITKLFLFEAALIGVLGGLLGSLFAVAVGTLLNPVISNKLGLGSVHLLEFKPLELVLLILILMLVAIIAGLLPARRASKLDPIAALRTE